MNPNAAASSRKGLAIDALLSQSLLAKALAAGAIPASGELAAAALPRLADAVISIDGPGVGQFAPQESRPALERSGGQGAPKRWWLEVRAEVTCTCERCLAPVAVSIASRRGFEFFASAGLADRRAQQMEEDLSGADPDADQVDLIVEEDRPTLLALMEDELLLELPMAPKHANCPPPA
jgi:uncharacterized protein